MVAEKRSALFMAKKRGTNEKVLAAQQTENARPPLGSCIEHFLTNAFKIDLNEFNVPGDATLTANEKVFYYKSVCVGNGDALEIVKITVSQKNTVWTNERRKRINASSCYDLYTYWKNKNQDWERKAANYYKVAPNIRNFIIGHVNEPIAMNAYKHLTQNNVQLLGLVVHPFCPWLGVSPDGVCLEKQILIEIKCLVPKSDEEFHVLLNKVKYLKNISQENANYLLNKKHKYYAQVQIGMFLLNLKSCDFIVFYPKKNE